MLMWTMQAAHSDRTSWARPGASTTLALIMHAAIVFALPQPTANHASIPELSSLEAVAFDLDVAARDASDNGSHAPSPIAAEAPATQSKLTRARRASRPAPPAANEHAEALRTAASEPAVGTDNVDTAADSPGDAAQVGASGEALGNATSDGSRSGTVATLGSEAPGTGRGARLIGVGDPCAGYFPAATMAPRGRVSIAVEIDPRGVVIGSQVLDVNPVGAGFAQAAQACVSRLRFAAATTPAGEPVRARTTLRLHFQRAP